MIRTRASTRIVRVDSVLNLLDCSNRMARAGKAGSAFAKSPSSATEPSFIHWFFQPAMLFRMSLIAGVFALWPYAAQKLPALGTRPEYRMAFTEIQLKPPPTHPVPSNLVEQVAELSGMPRELSLLSETLTSDVAQAFRRHPWVSKVIRVQKSFPAGLTVELEYREAVVMAEVQGGRIPIDVHGVILPTADFSTNDTNQYPLIQNVESKPKVRPGQVWTDPSILAAARLASQLKNQWKTLKLGAISVPRAGATSGIAMMPTDPNDVILELIGQSGSRIVWGRAPGSDHPGELEPAQKILRLQKYLVDYGDYDKPHGPYEIDIRHWQEISRRPLAALHVEARPVKLPKSDHKNSSDPAVGKVREAKHPKVDRKK